MQKRQKRNLLGVCLMVLILGLAACGTSGEEVPENLSAEGTGIVASEQPGEEGNITQQPEPTATPVPTAAPTTTPEPTHAPAKNEGIEIPAEYRKLKKDAAGTVEEITYTTKDYYGTGEEMTKPAYVYLPYGYDEEKQYNVIFLMHGGGGDETEWAIHTDFSTVRLVLDNMIYYGDIEPCIAVVPNGRSGVYYEKKSDSADGFMDFGLELRNDLIPYIDANYATYAEYSPEGYDVTAARDHRAIAGFSFGGMQSINVGLCECLDIISYFGAFSPATAIYWGEDIAKELEKFDTYEIGYIYEICGDRDTNCATAGYYALMPLTELTDKVVLGENMMLQIVPGGHETAVAKLGLYNFLQLIFK